MQTIYTPYNFTVSDISSGPPASPSTGDIWVATNVDTNGTRWQFQYNAGSASTYKWEFIGGPPTHVAGNPSLLYQSLTQIGVTGWYYWNNASGKITVARAGDYCVIGGGSIGYNAAAGQMQLALGNVTAASVPVGASRRDTHLDATDNWASVGYEEVVTGVAATTVLANVYSGGQNYNVGNQSLSVLPVRVA